MTVDADRLEDLVDACNLRDIGGIATRDGRATRHGVLFRSGALHALTEAQRAALADLGIALVIDMRSARERIHQPSNLPTPTWAREYDASNAELRRIWQRPDLSATHASELMMAVYRSVPDEQAETIGELCRGIARGSMPILLHCTAGKDRTGIAIAIVLELIGVARPMIHQEYLRTRRTLSRSMENVKASLLEIGLPPMEDAVLEPILAADSAYLDAMFLALESKYGATEVYARERLGLDQAILDGMREMLLGPAGA